MAIKADMYHNRMSGRDFMAVLERSGVDTSDCRRIVIDIPYDGVVTIYREDINARAYIAGIMEAIQKGEPLRIEVVDKPKDEPDAIDATAGSDEWVFIKAVSDKRVKS